ncbi:MAG: DUF1080 domain-containing protein [Sphingomonadaceae bacterium]|nr:DUF1080 domain-containing protein [Sphingomonadaceae bacterium]
MTRKSYLTAPAVLALLCAASAPLAAQQAPVPPGFTSIFDGKTLKGWRGDMSIWSVRDGAITGASDKVVENTTFLILNKKYPNFEIHFKYRFPTQVGNSGLQFRSGEMAPNFAMAGMQSNVTPVGKSVERFGMLYEESAERQEMVLLGQRAEITRTTAAGGGQGRIVRTVLATTNPREAVVNAVRPYPEWNEDVLIVHGNHMVHAINGLIAFDATDKDPLGATDGWIGLQFHHGPAFTVQFKDFVIKPLRSFPNIAGRFITKSGPAPEPHVTYKDSTKVNLPDTPLP